VSEISRIADRILVEKTGKTIDESPIISLNQRQLKVPSKNMKGEKKGGHSFYRYSRQVAKERGN